MERMAKDRRKVSAIVCDLAVPSFPAKRIVFMKTAKPERIVVVGAVAADIVKRLEGLPVFFLLENLLIKISFISSSAYR